MQLTRTRSSSSAAALQRSAGRSFFDGQGVEQLEARQLMTLLGVNLTELPLAFYVGNVSSSLTYNATSQGFDVVAIPTAVITPDYGYAEIIGGSLQIHQKVANDGSLVRGVNPNEAVANGSVNANGDDFIVTGGIDLDFSGTIDPGEPQGVLLRGEIIAFGFQDSGGPSDDYDFKFVATGGILATYFVNRDIGVNLVSEASDFTGSFATNISGQSKGAVGPVGAGDPGLAGASVAGQIFCDKNSNGIFDASGGDVGFGAVPVRLFGTNDLGQIVDITIPTNADGTYSFSGLRPGTYSVAQLANPAGTQDGGDYAGTAGGTVANDLISNVVLGAGVKSIGYNFTERCLATISGTKFLDANGNGLESSDQGMGGVTIYIDANNSGVLDSSEVRTVTASNGSFEFTGLTPGSYTIREVVPAGFIRTAPTNSDRYTVVVGSGQVVSNINFANAPIGNCVVTNVSYLINGTRTVSNLRGNTNQGDEITVIFTVPAGAAPSQLTLVSYTAPGASFVASQAAQQRIYDVATGIFGPGTYALTVHNPDSFYQVDFVCGSAIDTFGPAGSNIFYTPQRRLISADNDGNVAPRANASSISGSVFEDANDDGFINGLDTGIRDVTVTLTGTATDGTNVSISKRTDTLGNYFFGNLRPGNYAVAATQASGYADGKDSAGTAGGLVTNDRVSSIALAAGVNAGNYNFGELLSNTGSVGAKDTASASFWNGTNGQNLLRALNGSSNAEALSTWMASTFPNLWGPDSSNSLLGRTNSEIVSNYRAKFAMGGIRLEAQMMATAFNIFATDSQMAGGTMAASFGMNVSSTGSAFDFINVQSSGSALGFANHSNVTLIALLRAANTANAGNALLISTSANQSAVATLFDRINRAGGIF